MTTRERLLLIAPGVLFLVAFGSFELGRLASRKEAERTVAAKHGGPPPAPSALDDDALIRNLQAQDLDERRFSFARVIEGATGKAVTPFDAREPASTVILEAIRNAADHAMQIHSEESSPLRNLRRINEGSRFFEDTLRDIVVADFLRDPKVADRLEAIRAQVLGGLLHPTAAAAQLLAE